MGLIFGGYIDNVGSKTVLADGSGQANAVTRARVDISTGRMMKGKWCWLRQRPRKDKKNLLTLKHDKVQFVEIKTMIQTAKIVALF